MKKNIWEKAPAGNEILSRKTYFISYSRKTYFISYNGCIVISPYDILLNKLDGTPSREGKDETALKLHTGEWLILNGDFRKQYEKCKTYSECLKVYKKNIKHRSGYSTDKL